MIRTTMLSQAKQFLFAEVVKISLAEYVDIYWYFKVRVLVDFRSRTKSYSF